MAYGHGGPRTGSGRKNKPLAEKLSSGNPGKHKLTVLEFPETLVTAGDDAPGIRAYLTETQKDGRQILAADIYHETLKWLDERGCAALIPAQMIEQYAMAFARSIQCEQHISEFGFLARHPTTKAPIPSPYATMAQSYGKQASAIWYQIYQIIRENCAADFKGAGLHDDVMERLLLRRQ